MAGDLTFTQVKGSFVLRRRRANGRAVTIRLSPEETLGLERTIALWRDQLLTQHRVGSASVSPLLVRSIVGAEVQTDAVQANVLLTVGRLPAHE